MKNYYIRFIPEAEVNYLHLLSLYDLASYNTETKAFDTISYTSISKLAEQLPFSASTLNRMFSNTDYIQFLSIDKEKKVITINNCFVNGTNNNRFIRLSSNEVEYLRKQQDNLLIKYYIYIKYYCSLAKRFGKQQDFTSKQFLTAIGYSTKSTSQIDKVSSYNRKLKEAGLITVNSYRDQLGHSRNIYQTTYS